MVSRTQFAVIGLLASLAVSAVLYLHFGIAAFILVVPFVPFLLGGDRDDSPTLACPTCGYRTTDPAHEYCPRDGTELERA